MRIWNETLKDQADLVLLHTFKRALMMRTCFPWAVLVVIASLSLTSVAAQQTAAPSAKPAAAKHKAATAKPKAGVKALTAKPLAEKQHRIIIQVDQNDPAVMNLALNNATNVIDYYRAKGKAVQVDLVAYGPGLNMLREDTSPVKERIKQLKDYAFPGKIQFSACGNTKENMEKKEGKPISIVADAVIVPSGVVHLMELQEKGWSYVRP
jgi:uncharacterized protein